MLWIVTYAGIALRLVWINVQLASFNGIYNDLMFGSNARSVTQLTLCPPAPGGRSSLARPATKSVDSRASEADQCA